MPLLKSPQQPDERNENNEGQDEEGVASEVVQGAVREEARVDIVCEQGKPDDANAIIDDCKRNKHGHNSQLPPDGAKEEMPGHDTSNDERKSRSNPAASLIHANCHVRQSEKKTISNYRNTEQREPDVRDLSRTPLQKHNNRMKQAGWKGHHAKQEQETKGKCSASPETVTEEEDPPRGYHQGQDR